ncbi:MAG: MlaD family protein [Planctomycetes bacterium]|nr:MlaD family protein [Planctomycetota bacterium]
METRRQLLLGGLFVTVIAILGYYTLFLTEFSLFKERFGFTVYFPEAYGLRQGDSVLVAGIRQGRVKDMSYDPTAEFERRVTVTMLMDQPVELRDGFTIAIKDATLLGGKNIEIDPGPAGGGTIARDALLFGTIQRGALGALGDFVDKNGSRFENIVKNVDEVVADIKAGKGTVGRLVRDDELANKVDAAVTKIDATFDSASQIAADIKAGKGTLGRLVNDEELYGKVNEIADRLKEIGDNLAAVTKDVNEGKGTLGRLVKDEALADEVSKAVEQIRDITTKINEGQGTLGKLVVDPKLYDDFQEIVTKFKNGEGTMGKLFTNDEVYDKLAKIADDLATASDALKNGRGTLGKLIMDDELFEQVSKALATVTRTLEEYREAAPISAFTSVLFSAF